MHYSDGNEAMMGDRIAIDGKHQGVVVACIDRVEYSAEYPKEHWSHLDKGMLVDTDFGGLVHYENSNDEHFLLIERADKA